MTGKLIHKKVVFSPFQKLLITAIDTILVHAFRAKRHGQWVCTKAIDGWDVIGSLYLSLTKGFDGKMGFVFLNEEGNMSL